LADEVGIEELAAYLHVTPARVARMADRGQLPGRKIGGVWRFSNAEIHHWLEERIGGLDSDELEQLEEVLERGDVRPDSAEISIESLLKEQAIAVPLEARTRSSVIRSMVDLAAGTGLLWDPPKMVEAVRRREDLYPTALDTGVALLHPRRPMPSILGEAHLALGRTSQGIPFASGRGSLTDIFFLICSTDDRGHLRTLARLSRLLADAGFLDEMRATPDAAALWRVVVDREEKLFG